jgi:hypothetical protein
MTAIITIIVALSVVLAAAAINDQKRQQRIADRQWRDVERQ